MADTLPTTWAAETHTLAKHAVLKGYLDAWLPILSNQARKVESNRDILYIDAFAGPGEYTGGEAGSPVLALTAAHNHTLAFPHPINFLFIEKREDRFQHLQTLLTQLPQHVVHFC